MATTTHIEASRTGLFHTQVTITRTPVESLDVLKDRWINTIGRDQVIKAEHIEISRVALIDGAPSNNAYVETGFEVTFKNGTIGYVTGNHTMQELDALRVSESHIVIHGLSVWRKHRFLVGSPTPWVRSLRGRRGFIQPENSKVCKKGCAAELYARAAGRSWGLNLG